VQKISPQHKNFPKKSGPEQITKSIIDENEKNNNANEDHTTTIIILEKTPEEIERRKQWRK
jgi:hypothetical protein